MPNPVCHANRSVEESHVERVQRIANNQFTRSNPIQDRELLSSRALRVRERTIVAQTSLRNGGIRDLAERLTASLRPPTGFHPRTHVNILRLLSSDRVSTNQIVRLVNQMADPNQVTAFRNAAQTLFLSVGLFYYDYVPHQGAILCFQPRK